MKAAQLVVGYVYEDRKGVRLAVRQITTGPGTRVVYFEEGNFVESLPIQEFAARAKRRVA